MLLNWNVVEKRLRELISEDKYLSEEDKEKYLEYKEVQAKADRQYELNRLEHAVPEMETKKVTIDGRKCTLIDEWGTEDEKYLLGNDMEERAFYYAQVNDKVFEYDYKPERSEVGIKKTVITGRIPYGKGKYIKCSLYQSCHYS